MEMAESASPIRSESAWFRVNGAKMGKGVVLLYPDRLVRVRSYVEYACWIVMVAIADVFAYHIFRVIPYWLVPAFGIILGGVIGRAIDRWLAARTVAAGARNATTIPLDAIVSLRTSRSAWLGDWFVTEKLVVTRADGTEYTFVGRTCYVLADIAGALAGLGREVRATPQGLAVAPRAVDSGA